MKVRRALPLEAALLATVVRRSITELCADEYRHDPVVLKRWLANKTPDNFARWIEDDRHVVFVADAEPQIAGVGMITCEGEIQLVYVSPDFRFQGVSKALLTDMEDHARRLGLTEVRLGATQLARQMYEASGYRGEREVESQFGTLPATHMRKSL